MIIRLNQHYALDVIDLLSSSNLDYVDFYITKNNERVSLNNLDLLRKVLKRYEVYGLYDGGLKGLFLVYREKGFRPLVKFATSHWKHASKLLKFYNWTYPKAQTSIKINRKNSLIRLLNGRRSGFAFRCVKNKDIIFTRSFDYRNKRGKKQ